MNQEDYQALIAAHRGHQFAPLNRWPWENLLNAMSYAQDRLHVPTVELVDEGWDAFANAWVPRHEGPAPAIGFHGHGA